MINDIFVETRCVVIVVDSLDLVKSNRFQRGQQTQLSCSLDN